jgi:archaemetzincin
MSVLVLLPVGSPAQDVLDGLEEKLRGVFPWTVRRMPPLPRPVAAFNAVRGQFEALHIMRAIADMLPRDADKVLAVFEEDIAIPMLTFVFGQAQLNGRIALMSLARLRQEFYGMNAQPELLIQRVWKEALHELGHTFGLTHCQTPGCIMTLANNIQHVDEKGNDFCGGCKTLFTDARRALEQKGTKE